MAGFTTSRNVGESCFRSVFSSPPSTLLTISGAAITKSRNNFLFHYKSKRVGKQAANRLVQSGSISTKSLSLVDSIIAANGVISGVCVTQPPWGYQIATGGRPGGPGRGKCDFPLISKEGKQTFAETSHNRVFETQALLLFKRTGRSWPVQSKHTKRAGKTLWWEFLSPHVTKPKSRLAAALKTKDREPDVFSQRHCTLHFAETFLSQEVSAHNTA